MAIELPLPSGKCIKCVWHVADLHIRCGSKVDMRLDDYKTTFCEFVDRVRQTQCISETVVVICGDVFHKTRLGASGISLFRTLLHDLSELCPTYIIRGNHDFLKSDPDATDMIGAFIDDSEMSNVAYLKEGYVYTAGDVGFGVFSGTSVPDDASFPRHVCTKIALYHGMVIGARMDHLTPVSEGVSMHAFEEYNIGMFGDIHLQQVHNANRSSTDPTDSKLYFGKSGFVWGYSGSLIQQTFGELPINHGALKWDLKHCHVTPVLLLGERAYLKVRKDSEWMTDYGEYSVPISAIVRRLPKHIHVRASSHTTTASDRRDLSEYLSKMLPHATVEGLSDSDITESHVFQNRNTTEASTLENTLRMLSTDDPNDPERWKDSIALGDVSLRNIASVWITTPSSCMPVECIGVPPCGLETAVETASSKIENAIDAYEKTSITRSCATSSKINFERLEFDWLLCFGAKNVVDFSTIESTLGVIASPNGTGKSALLEIVALSLFGTGHESRRCEAFTGHVVNERKPPKARASTHLVLRIVSSEDASIRRFRIMREFAQQNAERRLLEKTAWVDEWKNGSWVSLIPRRAKSSKAAESKIREIVGEERGFFDMACVAQRGDRDFFDMDAKTQSSMLCSTTNVEPITSFSHMCDVLSSGFGSIEKHVHTAIGALKSGDDVLCEEGTTLSLLREREQDFECKCKEYDVIAKRLECTRKMFSEFDESLMHLTPDDVKRRIVENGNVACRVGGWTVSDDMRLQNYKTVLSTIPVEGSVLRNKSGHAHMTKTHVDTLCNTLRNAHDASCDLLKEDVCMSSKTYQTVFDVLRNALGSPGNETEVVEALVEMKHQTMNVEYESLKIEHAITVLQKEIDKLHALGLSVDFDIHEVCEPDVSLEKCREMQTWFETSNVTDGHVAEIERRVSARIRERELRDDLNELSYRVDEMEKVQFNAACECCMAHPDHIRLQDLKSQKDSLMCELRDLRIMETRSIVTDCAKDDDDWLKMHLEWKSRNYSQLALDWERFTRFQQHVRLKTACLKISELKKERARLHNQEAPTMDTLDSLIRVKDKVVYWITCNSQCKSLLENARSTRAVFREQIASECARRLNRHVKMLEYRRDVSIEASRTGGVRTYLEKQRAMLTRFYELMHQYGSSTAHTVLEQIASDVEQSRMRKVECLSNLRVLQERVRVFEARKERVRVLTEYGTKARHIRDTAKKFQERMIEYRLNIFEQCVLPRFVSLVNAISASSTQNCVLHASIFRNAPSWSLRTKSGGGYIRVEKASGFQRATLGLSAKIALGILCNTSRYNTLFIDEGFVACDDDHLARIPKFLSKLLSIYDSLVLVTHLEGLRDSLNGCAIRITYDESGNSRVVM